MSRLKDLILHPFLIAAYPVLALLAYNVEQIDSRIALRSLLLSLVLAGVLLLLFRLLFKSWKKAGMLASLTLILFFSYGRIYTAARLLNAGPLPLGRHRLLLPLFLIIWAVLVWLVVRYRGDLRTGTQTVNIIAMVALLFPLFSFVQYNINLRLAPAAQTGSQALAQPLSVSEKPDIYYIILDGYARDDVLQERWKYDNSEFLQALQERGFYVARCSKSNFGQTELSLASSLNMQYLQDLDPLYAASDKRTRATLPATIRDGAARRYLEELGYKTIGFESGYGWTDLRDADIFLTPQGGYRENASLLGGANQFEVMLMDTSALILLTDATLKLPAMLKPDLQSHERMLREHILYILDTLPKVPRLPGPKFVFAHIVSPHSPYIFGPDGEETENAELDTIVGYTNQVKYLNKRILPIIDEIIAQSETPPIIIIQGDHGWARNEPERRMRILNAYYLPGGGNELLYDEISPVNTFRLIFNRYFDAGLPLLDDLSYYSAMSSPYNYIPIADGRPGCEQ
jgi:hypothetical protein